MNPPDSVRKVLDRLVQATRKTPSSGQTPDPIRYPARFQDPEDIAASGLIAASLAMGQVHVMLDRLNRIFGVLGADPAHQLRTRSPENLMTHFTGFRYRFVNDRALVSFLSGLGGMLRGGPMEALLIPEDVIGSTVSIRNAVLQHSPDPDAICNANLLADPDKGSALKRWMLFFRWMARRDPIDFGIWEHHISRRNLIVPVDTHMLRIARLLGLTERKSSDMKTALEITAGFRQICPEDPVKYDFALVRLGIEGLCTKLNQGTRCVSCPLQPHCSTGRMGTNLNQSKGNGP